MKFPKPFILLGLLVSGCGSDNTSLQQQLVGVWVHGDYSVSIRSDGSYFSKLATSNEVALFTQQGTWVFTNSILLMTITNVSGRIHQLPVGSIGKAKIIELSSSHLVVEQNGQTNYLDRR
jgi:hypothetical protein